MKNTKLRQRRSDRTNENFRRLISTYDKSTDDNSVTGSNSAAGGKVDEFRTSYIQVVKFKQSHAGNVGLACENGGVIPRRQSRDQGRLAVVSGSQLRRQYLGRFDVQLSLVLSKTPLELNNFSTGSVIAPATPARLSDGPRPRISTFLATLPLMTNPPIVTFSPVCTKVRVATLIRC